MSKYPQMSGMQQVIMSPPTDAELDAAAEKPRECVVSGSSIKVIENIGKKEPVRNLTYIPSPVLIILTTEKSTKCHKINQNFPELFLI